jgi:nitrate reductase beta subunit
MGGEGGREAGRQGRRKGGGEKEIESLCTPGQYAQAPDVCTEVCIDVGHIRYQCRIILNARNSNEFLNVFLKESNFQCA